MAYKGKLSDYKEDDLYKVAEMHFIKGLSHEEIARQTQYGPRQKISAMCQTALDEGIVLVYKAMRPSPTANSGRLDDLASKVRERFGLKHCILVNGQRRMLDNDLPPALKETIVDNIARRTAGELDRRCQEEEAPCVAVTYGFLMRKVADYLHYEDTVPRPGRIVAAQGARRCQADRFDSNDIIRGITRQYGCEYLCMPAPALVPSDMFSAVRDIPLIKDVVDCLENETNIILSSLGSRYEAFDEGLDALSSHLYSQEELDEIVRLGGIGNLGGIWFDSDGTAVRHTGRQMLGLSFERRKQLVEQGKPVILAVGADPRRIPALWIALEKKLANIWIGDEATAHALIGKWRVFFEDGDHVWREDEQNILNHIARTRPQTGLA